MEPDRWGLGRKLYAYYVKNSEVKLCDWDSLALYQKETWQRTASEFNDIIGELTPVDVEEPST